MTPESITNSSETLTIERPALRCPVNSNSHACEKHPCTEAIECVTIAGPEGGMYGGPEPKYMYAAQPGEVLHRHFTVCKACNYISEYNANGLYKVTRK